MRALLIATCAAICFAVTPTHAETRTAIPTQYGSGAFSPDGSSLAVSTGAGQITLYAPDSGKVLGHLRRRDDRLPDHLAWRPDGKRLISAGVLAMHDMDDCQEIPLPGEFAKRHLHRIGWSRDGRKLFGVSTSSVLVWSPESGDPPQSFTPGGHYHWSGALSPDAKSLVSISEHGHVHLFDLVSGEPRELATGYGWCECYIDWHPRRNILALSGHSKSPNPRVKLKGENKIRLWDLKASQPLFDLPGPAKGAILCFSPDGETLAVAHGWLNRWSSAAPNAAITLWDVNSGELRHALQTDERQVRFLAWSADSKRLASGGPFLTYVREGNEIKRKRVPMKVSLWNPAGGKLVRTFGRN
jgi:WD40 repeat protein